MRITTPSGDLDLCPDSEIDFTINHPLFQDDAIPVSHAFEIKFPKTNRNKRIFAYNEKRCCCLVPEVPCDIYVGGLRLLSGVLVFFESDNQFIYETFTSASIPSAADKTLNQIDLGRWVFGDIKRNYTEFGKLKALIQRAVNGNEGFVVAPVYNTLRDGKKINGNFNDGLRYYANYYNPSREDVVADGIPGSTTIGMIYPCVRLGYILEKVFQGIDDRVFAGGAFNRVVVMSTFFDEYHNISPDHGLHVTNKNGTVSYMLDLASRMPAVKVSDLIKAALKLADASLFYSTGRWRVVSNEELINGVEFDDWTKKVSDTYLTSMEKGKRYKISYGSGETNNKIDSTLPKTMAPTILSMLTSDDINDRYFVIKDINTVFRRSFSDQAVFRYELISNGFSDVPSEDSSLEEEYEVAIDASPVTMHPHWSYYSAENGDIYWYTPQDEVVVPNFEVEVGNRPSEIRLGIYHGLTTFQRGARTYRYPFISDNGIDINGNDVGISLEPKKMVDHQHKRHAEWIATDRMVTHRSFNIDALDVAGIDIMKKKMIGGTLFFFREINIRIDSRGNCTAEGDMIEA